MTRYGLILLGLALSLEMADAPDASAQELHACYNNAGVLYLIGEPGLKTECTGDHVQVVWSVTGPPGQQGPPGISGIHVVQSDLDETVGAGDVGAAAALCPPGEVAMGGGSSDFTVLAGGIEPVLTQSSPFLDSNTGLPIGWSVHYANTGTGEFSFKAAVICAIVGS